MRLLLFTAFLVLLVLMASSCYFTVDRTEFVYLTHFGQHVATLDGEHDAGLHWKWPWPIQNVQRLDHRLQVFDLPEAELLTHDPKGKTIDKTITVGAYVCWRIGDTEGVDRFLRTVGDPRQARNILGQRISSRLGAEVGNLPVDDLIGVAPPEQVEARMNRLRDRVLTGGNSGENLQELARRTYGIEIVDIRLRRFNHPPSVRGEIFARIKSEREKKATEYRTEGEKLASDIRSLAEREAKDIDTEARSRAERLRKEADIKADEIRNQAQSQDRDFYVFLQKLQAYQKILGDTRDVLLLSGKHELFDLLLKPPKSERGTRNGERGTPAEGGKP